MADKGKWQKRIERTEEKVAKKTTGRCTFFCGDVRCPAACNNK
jgi:hypothetical protein